MNIISKKYFYCYMLYIFFFSSLAQQNTDNKNEHSGRKVMEGKFASREQFPYIASICQNHPLWSAHTFIIQPCAHWCAGAIISSTWLLTSAHCFEGNPDKSILQVIAGILKPAESHQDIQFRKVSEVIIHPDYHREALLILNNIALVRTDYPLDYNKSVRQIQLPDTGNVKAKRSVTAGWGISFDKEPYAVEPLQFLLVSVMNRRECERIVQERFPKTELTRSHVCTLSFDDNYLCIGDGGSPLIQNDRLVGLISYALQDCRQKVKDASLPVIYTRIGNYLDFINKQGVPELAKEQLNTQLK